LKGLRPNRKSFDIVLIRVEVNSDPGTCDLAIGFMDEEPPGKDDGATGGIEGGIFTVKPQSFRYILTCTRAVAELTS
jgi:hypothetical protein